MTDTDFAGAHAQPGQYREAHVADDGQVTTGAGLELFSDGVFVVIGIEHHRRDQRDDDNEHQKIENSKTDKPHQTAGGTALRAHGIVSPLLE